MPRAVLLLTAVLCWVVPAAPARSADADKETAARAFTVLEKYCHGCHGVEEKKPGFRVLNRDILIAKRDGGKKVKLSYVKPGKLAESLLWQRLDEDADMPPPDQPQPSAADKQLVKRWIEAGAPPFPTADAPRTFLSERDVLTVIHQDLQRTDRGDRPFRRYFTLTNLHNNPTVRRDELDQCRAALSKVVNSLSLEPDIHVPRPVDPEQTVLSVDVRKLGWDKGDLWREVLRAYPYGLTHDDDPDPALRNLAQNVYQLAGNKLPYLRADWFIVTASQPPLYHTLLRLPEDVGTLERQLGVDVDKNFLHDDLARAAFAKSGVSRQNRMVERHRAAHGAYWKSYDFLTNAGTGNLFRFPLGPVFADNPFPRLAFEQAGGELIFNLPNGLQGYLLIDARGKRINEGPTNVVSDSKETAGKVAVVNGISCMHCHKNGMIRDFKDTVRASRGVFGAAQEKVERLYPEPAEMEKLLAKDEDRFLKALGEAIGPFVKAGDVARAPEPVYVVAVKYLKEDVGLEKAACELGIKDPAELRSAIRFNDELRKLGLGPFAEGDTIKRETWEALPDRLPSQFQQAALALNLGTPFRVRK
jgi:hypothetical protein